jgi:hypothetical protein
MYSAVTIPYAGRPAIYISNDYFMWKGGDTYSKFQEFDLNAKYDVVVVGSSRAYRGYNPACFADSGMMMFNLGTSAQSIINTDIVVRNYIRPGTTKLLIVDLYAGAFRSGQLESSADLIENVSTIETAEDIAGQSTDPRVWNMYVLRRLTETDKPYFAKDDYTGSGYSEKKDSLSPSLVKLLGTFKQSNEADLVIDSSAFDALERMLSYCSANKIEVVLVYSPVTDFYSRANHAVFTDAITPLINKHHVKYFDYTSSLHLNTQFHFYDDTHLNSAGVAIFNSRLIADLRAAKSSN